MIHEANYPVVPRTKTHHASYKSEQSGPTEQPTVQPIHQSEDRRNRTPHIYRLGKTFGSPGLLVIVKAIVLGDPAVHLDTPPFLLPKEPCHERPRNLEGVRRVEQSARRLVDAFSCSCAIAHVRGKAGGRVPRAGIVKLHPRVRRRIQRVITHAQQVESGRDIPCTRCEVDKAGGVHMKRVGGPQYHMQAEAPIVSKRDSL